MAEPTTLAPVHEPATERRGALSPYRAVLASRIRAQRSYKANFRLDLFSSLLIGLIELAESWVLFHNVHELGGLTFVQVLLVFGLADLPFSLADLAFGHCDNLPTYLRAGTLDVFYLRPQPLLLQLISSDISLRRLARGLVGIASITVAISINDVHWSVATVFLLIISAISAFFISAGMFVWAGGIQFFLISGAEMTNAFVYGGRYASTQPAAVWSRPLKLIFGFLFPMAFTAYLPSLVLLDLPGPEWLPSWLAWCSPLAAIWTWVMALTCWRWGVRHYQGGGG
ncbi:MAG TPA: ABC-2 family transporter protein [Mycobacteriales bacterium]|nr:ABC-2 family transporter protein [Mycobacteriales bacterium]